MERRFWQRKEKKLKCWINTLHYHDSEDLECTTRDISVGGAYLLTSQKLPKNHLIEVRFSSDVTNHMNQYSLFGYVVREDEDGSAFEIRRANKLTMHRLYEMIQEH